MPTEMSMKGSGSQIKLMEKAFISIQMALPTMEIGKMTISMELDKKLGPMAQSTTANILKAKKMGKASFNGLTKHFMMESLGIITLKGMENIIGVMAEFTKELGKIIKCMDMEIFNGRTEKDILEIILKIKKKGEEYLYGQMVENMMESGKMVNSTAKVF